MTQAIAVAAYAKINWSLELLGKRDDGYHEIRTVTQTISLCDELQVSSSGEGIDLWLGGDWATPAGAANICWRAAEGFQEAFGVPSGIRIALHKRAPSGSGLGGGSSDCVATLAALARLTGIDAPDRMRELAASLGSDTVLFIDGGAALCSGRGEVVEPVESTREHNLVIARPDCAVRTAWAYAQMTPDDFSDGSSADAVGAALAEGAAPEVLAGLLRNAFRPRVSEQFPEIDDLVDDMRDAGAIGAEMTGSGSAVFGLVANAEDATDVAGRLKALGYWAIAARTVDVGHAFTEASPND